MHSSKFLIVLLIRLTAATVAAAAARARSCLENSPSAAKGFKLIANATNPTRLFSPHIQGWFLGSVRTSPGVFTSTLTPDSNASTPGWQNRTKPSGPGRDGTSIIFDLTPPSTPLGLTIEALDRSLPDSDYVSWVGTRYGSGTPGFGVGDNGVVYAPPVGGSAGGTFIVCNATAPLAPEFPISWAMATKKGGAEGEVQEIPSDCVPIELLAMCEDNIPALPDGVEYNRDFAQEVRCLRGIV